MLSPHKNLILGFCSCSLLTQLVFLTKFINLRLCEFHIQFYMLQVLRCLYIYEET